MYYLLTNLLMRCYYILKENKDGLLRIAGLLFSPRHLFAFFQPNKNSVCISVFTIKIQINKKFTVRILCQIAISFRLQFSRFYVNSRLYRKHKKGKNTKKKSLFQDATIFTLVTQPRQIKAYSVWVSPCSANIFLSIDRAVTLKIYD